MKLKTSVSALCALLVVTSSSSIRAEGVALGVKVGTMGPGLELTAPLLETLNVRLGGTYLPYSFNGEISGVNYDIAPRLATASVLLDWHPFSNGFRLSGGGVYNDSGIDLDSNPDDNTTIDIGDHVYSSSDLGALTGTVEYKKIAPYVGIGYGNAVEPGRTWGFSFDLGVIFTGSADVTLEANGPMAGNAEAQSDIAHEESDIQDVLDLVTVYPVLAFGISYNF